MMDSVSSTTFIKRPPCVTDLQEKFLYTREVLSGRIFLGCYLERRYVEALNEYRDVVAISDEETDLYKDLNKVLKKWESGAVIKWVGITRPNKAAFQNVYCFWVKLTDTAFGHYWFQIKHVKLVGQEVLLHLKCIRKSKAPLVSLTPGMRKEETSEENVKYRCEASSSTFPSEKRDFVSFDAKKMLTAIQLNCKDALENIRPHITWENLVTVVRVGCAFSIFLIMGTISVLGNLGVYVLQLIREVTYLVNAFTPIVIQLIDLLSKIIGGFFILLARIFIRNYEHRIVQPHKHEIIPSIEWSRRNLSSSGSYPSNWRERNRLLKQELLSE